MHKLAFKLIAVVLSFSLATPGVAQVFRPGTATAFPVQPSVFQEQALSARDFVPSGPVFGPRPRVMRSLRLAAAGLAVMGGLWIGSSELHAQASTNTPSVQSSSEKKVDLTAKFTEEVMTAVISLKGPEYYAEMRSTYRDKISTQDWIKLLRNKFAIVVEQVVLVLAEKGDIKTMPDVLDAMSDLSFYGQDYPILKVFFERDNTLAMLQNAAQNAATPAEKSIAVRRLAALSHIITNDPSGLTVGIARTFIHNTDPEDIVSAIQILRYIHPADAVTLVWPNLKHLNAHVKENAYTALSIHLASDPRAFPLARDLLRSENPEERGLAIKILEHDPQAAGLIEPRLKDADPKVAEEAGAAIQFYFNGHIADPEFHPHYLILRGDWSGLRDLGEKALPALFEALSHNEKHQDEVLKLLITLGSNRPDVALRVLDGLRSSGHSAVAWTEWTPELKSQLLTQLLERSASYQEGWDEDRRFVLENGEASQKHQVMENLFALLRGHFSEDHSTALDRAARSLVIISRYETSDPLGKGIERFRREALSGRYANHANEAEKSTLALFNAAEALLKTPEEKTVLWGEWNQDVARFRVIVTDVMRGVASWVGFWAVGLTALHFLAAAKFLKKPPLRFWKTIESVPEKRGLGLLTLIGPFLLITLAVATTVAPLMIIASILSLGFWAILYGVLNDYINRLPAWIIKAGQFLMHVLFYPVLMWRYYRSFITSPDLFTYLSSFNGEYLYYELWTALENSDWGKNVSQTIAQEQLPEVLRTWEKQPVYVVVYALWAAARLQDPKSIDALFGLLESSKWIQLYAEQALMRYSNLPPAKLSRAFMSKNASVAQTAGKLILASPHALNAILPLELQNRPEEEQKNMLMTLVVTPRLIGDVFWPDGETALVPGPLFKLFESAGLTSFWQDLDHHLNGENKELEVLFKRRSVIQWLTNQSPAGRSDSLNRLVEHLKAYSIESAATNRTLDFSHWPEGRLSAFLALSSSDLFITNGLLERLASKSPEVQAQSVADWSRLKRKFENKTLLFHPEDPDHVEIGYTLFRSEFHPETVPLTRRPLNRQQRDHSKNVSYENYLQFLKSHTGRASDISVLNDQHQAELLYLAYEALRFESWVLELKARATASGRPVLVVENLRYGGLALSPVRDHLKESGIRIVSTKIGSTESHQDPHVLGDDMFDVETLRFIIEERPIIVVVDASTSVNNPTRTIAHYPDAYQGYRNFGMALHDFYGEKEKEVAQNFGMAPGFFKDLKQTSKYQRLLGRFRSIRSSPAVDEEATGGMAFWTPTEVPLQIREKKKGLGWEKSPVSLEPESWEGQDMIFVQVAMDPMAVQNRASAGDRAAQFVLQNTPPRYGHQAAYFDDTDHFVSLEMKLGPYGPEFTQAYAEVAEGLAAQLRGLNTLSEGAPITQDVPYRLIISDYDATLGITKKPLHAALATTLLRLLAQGTDVAIVTVQGIEEIKANLLVPLLGAMRHQSVLSVDALSRLHLFPDLGVRGYDVTPGGEVFKVWDYLDETRASASLEQLHRQAELFRDSLPKEATFSDHQGLPVFRKVPHRESYKKQFEKMIIGLPFDIIKVGRTALHVYPQGATKAVARDYLLSRFSTVPHASILTLGNDYTGSRVSDNFLVIPDARNISVAGSKPGLGIEHVGFGPTGAYEVLRSLFNTRDPKALPEKLKRAPSSYRRAASLPGVILQAAVAALNLDQAKWAERIRRTIKTGMRIEMMMVSALSTTLALRWIGVTSGWGDLGLDWLETAVVARWMVFYGLAHLPFIVYTGWKTDSETYFKNVFTPPALFMAYGTIAWAAGFGHPISLLLLPFVWFWHYAFDQEATEARGKESTLFPPAAQRVRLDIERHRSSVQQRNGPWGVDPAEVYANARRDMDSNVQHYHSDEYKPKKTRRASVQKASANVQVTSHDVEEFVTGINPILQKILENADPVRYPSICHLATTVASELLQKRFGNSIKVSRVFGSHYDLPHSWMELIIGDELYFLSFTEGQFTFWEDDQLRELHGRSDPHFLQVYRDKGYSRVTFQKLDDFGIYSTHHFKLSELGTDVDLGISRIIYEPLVAKIMTEWEAQTVQAAQTPSIGPSSEKAATLDQYNFQGRTVEDWARMDIFHVTTYETEVGIAARWGREAIPGYQRILRETGWTIMQKGLAREVLAFLNETQPSNNEQSFTRRTLKKVEGGAVSVAPWGIYLLPFAFIMMMLAASYAVFFPPHKRGVWKDPVRWTLFVAFWTALILLGGWILSSFQIEIPHSYEHATETLNAFSLPIFIGLKPIRLRFSSVRQASRRFLSAA